MKLTPIGKKIIKHAVKKSVIVVNISVKIVSIYERGFWKEFCMLSRHPFYSLLSFHLTLIVFRLVKSLIEYSERIG